MPIDFLFDLERSAKPTPSSANSYHQRQVLQNGAPLKLLLYSFAKLNAFVLARIKASGL